MSLLRLLTAGRSLVEFKDTPGTYQMTSQRLLPHFGPASNPFSSKATASAVPAAERVEVIRTDVQDRKTSATAGKHTRTETLRLRAASRLKAWRDKCQGWFGEAGGRAARPAIPRFTKQPVQGELSLDRVRVVRNDLSDADLEIVPAKSSASQRSSALAVPGETVTSVTAGSWSRVANRIFGAGKT